jgi:hypothetical protein
MSTLNEVAQANVRPETSCKWETVTARRDEHFDKQHGVCSTPHKREGMVRVHRASLHRLAKADSSKRQDTGGNPEMQGKSLYPPEHFTEEKSWLLSRLGSIKFRASSI